MILQMQFIMLEVEIYHLLLHKRKSKSSLKTVTRGILVRWDAPYNIWVINKRPRWQPAHELVLNSLMVLCSLPTTTGMVIPNGWVVS